MIEHVFSGNFAFVSELHEWYYIKCVNIGYPDQTRHLDAHHRKEIPKMEKEPYP